MFPGGKKEHTDTFIYLPSYSINLGLITCVAEAMAASAPIQIDLRKETNAIYLCAMPD